MAGTSGSRAASGSLSAPPEQPMPGLFKPSPGPRGPWATGGSLSFLLEELRPRAKELRYSLHLLRKSLLAMLGLAIVASFIFLAFAGPFLAPYPFSYHNDEKNGPPAGRPVVSRNESALDFSGYGWAYVRQGQEFPLVSNQNLARQTLATDDDLRALSGHLGDSVIFRRFQLRVYTDEIRAVIVTLQYNSSDEQPGSLLDIAVSWDNGNTWSGVIKTPLRFSDEDQSWFTLDFSNATAWNAWKLADLNFVVRIVHDFDPSLPFPAKGVGMGLDALRVIVLFNGDYHVLGTTVDGEDVISGLLLGAAISIRIGLIVVVIGTLIGSVLGAVAGYTGGPLDELIMRITDIFLSIPGLILAMAVAAAIGRSLDTVMYALIVVWWPPYTRLVRGQALSVRENTYIEAARASGGSEMRVVGRHILPNTLSPILVQASLDVGSVVLVAAGLSYLGLGAQAGTPEWGLMVSKGFTYFPPAGNNWWQVGFAGLMIFLFVLGFNLLGDGVRDILDPRLRR